MSLVVEEPQPHSLLKRGLPLGFTIDPKLKLKIWNNEFMELAQLLHPDDHSKYNFSLDPSGGGLISWTKEKKEIQSTGNWSRDV